MPKESIPRSKSGRIMDYLANRSNIGRPFRAIKGLIDDPPSLTGPIREKDIERSFDAAGAASAGSIAGRRPRNSVGTGGRPYKVSGSQSQVKVTQPKPGTKKFIGPVKSSGKDSSKSKPRKSDSGTFTSRVDATRKRERTAREKEQFGPLVKRRTTEVTEYKRPGGPVKKYERPGGPVTKYERQGGSVAKYERPSGAMQTSNAAGKRDLMRSGERGGRERIVGISPAGKMILGGGAAAAGYAGYNAGVDKGESRDIGYKPTKLAVDRKESGYRGPNRGLSQSAAAPGKTDRATSGKQSFKDKMQGRNWKRDAAKSESKADRKVERKVERKTERKAENKPKIRGNWKGASPSAMQARGGVRRTKAENLRRLFREK